MKNRLLFITVFVAVFTTYPPGHDACSRKSPLKIFTNNNSPRNKIIARQFGVLMFTAGENFINILINLTKEN